MNDPLVDRFNALIEPSHPDWEDVRRRARRTHRPILIVAAVALIVSTPALALIAHEVVTWNDTQSASPAIVKVFATLDEVTKHPEIANVTTRTPFDLGILPSQARKVVLQDGTNAYVAPETSGGFCVYFENPADSAARAIDCQRGRPIRSITAGWRGGATRSNSSDGKDDERVVYLHGHVIGDPFGSLRVEFKDGSRREVPVTWIGPPINAGIFFQEIILSRQLTALVLLDASGNVIGRDTHAMAVLDLLVSNERNQQDNPVSHSNPETTGSAPVPGGFSQSPQTG